MPSATRLSSVDHRLDRRVSACAGRSIYTAYRLRCWCLSWSVGVCCLAVSVGSGRRMSLATTVMATLFGVVAASALLMRVLASMSRHSVRHRRWNQLRAEILSLNDVCWICSHPYSETLDHILSPKYYPELRMDPANLRPAHGVRGCPTCGRRCNQERGDKLEVPSPKPESWW